MTDAVPGGRYPSAPIAWYGMAVFVVAQIVATMDRGILSFVVEPVRIDLGGSDVQISLLQGLAFAVFYATVGLPLGMVADRVSRRRLLVAGIAAWSIATFLSGFAQNFGELFVCRLFVGLGEATLGPCAISLIGDMFPPSRRARPMSFYLFGGTISSGLAILLTGAIVGMAPASRAAIPLIGDLAPWRLAFLICGLLGLVTAVLLLAMPDLRRAGTTLAIGPGLGLRAVGGYFAARAPLFLPLFAGVGLWTTASASITGWAVPAMMRRFDADLPSIGHRLGLWSLAMATAGSLLAALVLPAVSRHGPAAKLRLACVLPLLALPGALLVLAPDFPSALALAAMPSFALPLYGATMLSTLSDLVPANVRGVAVALYAFCGTMIGATIGPLAVALLTEHVFGRPAAVGSAIALVAAPALVATGLMFATAERALRRTLRADAGFHAIVAANQRA